MQLKLFTIPAFDDGGQLQALNAFMANHKVLEVEQKFFQNDKGAYWCFCVRFIDGVQVNQVPQPFKPKIDYKEVLNESQFAVFSLLRQCRKQLASEDAVPAYAVFTDEELAEMVKMPELNASKLIGIKGIGDKKIAKYGMKLIERYQQMATANETSEPAS
jgi:superfamily II DNA helicase RecQ